MTRRFTAGATQLAVTCAPLLVFLVVLAVFGTLDSRFLAPRNFINILDQAAPIAIVAVGITFVLLTGGIDLSVGANMYLTVAVIGVYWTALPPPLALAASALVGTAFGIVNAALVVRLSLVPFVVTLATLFIGRGIAQVITETRQVRFSAPINEMGRGDWWGVPWSLWILAAVLLVAWLVLRETAYGRQVYAVGENREGAAKAGIAVRPTIASVYVICGACAGVGGLVLAAQGGAAGPSFGLEREFDVIAAAVLGGTSLFGGRGGVVGSVFGAVLIKTIHNGLIILNVSEYAYPLVTAAVIFFAVAVDAARTGMLQRLARRVIRVE